MKVYLIGVGMGNPATLTAQAREAIEESTLLLGAPRLLEPYGHKLCEALLLAGDIAARIRREPAGPVGVLLSGDVGFYSGAAGLRKELTDCELVSIPGISSLTYFCALLNTTWQDVRWSAPTAAPTTRWGRSRATRAPFCSPAGPQRRPMCAGP